MVIILETIERIVNHLFINIVPRPDPIKIEETIHGKQVSVVLFHEGWASPPVVAGKINDTDVRISLEFFKPLEVSAIIIFLAPVSCEFKTIRIPFNCDAVTYEFTKILKSEDI